MLGNVGRSRERWENTKNQSKGEKEEKKDSKVPTLGGSFPRGFGCKLVRGLGGHNHLEKRGNVVRHRT